MLTCVAACGPARPGPERPDPLRGRLPPIPERTGALELDLVHPPEEAVIGVRDSTFVFGSTGTGAARLSINGAPVAVRPNGAFLAFLPVPADGEYRLLAVAAGDTAELVREVEVAEPPPALARDSAVILESTIAPRGGWAVLPDERIEVVFEGTPGGRATLQLPDGTVIPLVEQRPDLGSGRARRAFEVEARGLAAEEQAAGVSAYRGYFAARPLVAADTSVRWPTLGRGAGRWGIESDADGDGDAESDADRGRGGSDDESAAVLRLVVGGDTARAALPLNLVVLDPDRPRVGVAVDREPEDQPTNGVVTGRPGFETTYHYFWPPGTALALTGERDGQYRVRLTSDLSAWVSTGEVVLLRPGTPPPEARVGTVRLTPYRDAIDVRFSLPRRVPFRIDEGERRLEVTLYGAVSDTDFLQYGGLDPLIRRASWSQPRDDVYRLVLELNQPPWGHRVFWAVNGDLIVRIRRPPALDEAAPLEGLLVAVDAGHPPAGATGPTRLTEAEANLGIARALADLLREAGARVLETRPDTTAVPLYARTRAATEANADLLVSVHNNAFPDGVNPFENAGTSVYYFHPRSAPLARALQAELLVELGLRDLGIGRADLALARPSWMPAVLSESMFLMVPEQEAALRDPAVRRRIARAHLEAIRAFLLERAGEQRAGRRE
ncbi:MAG: N-acetylmuramoyl-L-alanine amidase family protein [Gemmatimonadota bacterium]